MPLVVRPPMFRFTIRDVLWLTVVVGLLAARWLDHRKIAAVQAASAEREALLIEQNRKLIGEAKLANEQSDKAWAAVNDPFYRRNPLDDLLRSKRLHPTR